MRPELTRATMPSANSTPAMIPKADLPDLMVTHYRVPCN